MKKLAILILVLVLCSEIGFSTNPTPQMKTVVAPSGLSLREAPAASSPIIKIIPYGEMVMIRVDQPDTVFTSRIDWVDGEWIVVEHEGSVGFIFNGFLTSLPLPSYTAEFSPYDTELIYPLETWANYNFTKTSSPDTIIRQGRSKVIHTYEAGHQLVQSNQLGYYKSELTLKEVRLMDAYHLLLAMLGDNQVAINTFKKNSVFIEDYKGAITQVKINLDDQVSIRKVGPDTIKITISSLDQYCKL